MFKIIDRSFRCESYWQEKCNSSELIMCLSCSGTSAEMEVNVHVTKSLNKVQSEISFIFPNYIHEPIIYSPEQIKSCVKKFLAESSISTLSDIATNSSNDLLKSWKRKLAESIILPNRSLPVINNQCRQNVALNAQDTAQQTKIASLKYEKRNEQILERSFSSDFSKHCWSLNFTTSSCVSCSSFDSGAVCVKQTYQESLEDAVKDRTAPLFVSELSSTSRSSVHAEQQDILDEENVVEVNFSKFVEDQTLFNDQIPKEQIENNFKETGILAMKLNSENNIPSPVLVNTELISVKDLSDKKSTQLSNAEDESSMESILLVAETNNHKNEEISLPPTQYVPAEGEKQPGEKLSTPSEENMSVFAKTSYN